MHPHCLLLLSAALWTVCILQAFRFRRLGRLSRRQEEETPARKARPAVSIVVPCQEQDEQLMALLPVLLTQEYHGDYEVIVVDMCASRDTLDMLEQLEDTYPHLHHTFCPPTARDISVQRLALSLGMKAANHEWVLFLTAEARIADATWLSHFAAFCDDSADAVLGTTCYEAGGGSFGRHVRFLHLWQQMAWLPCALHHAPYRIHSGCLCYRRSHFLRHQGFASSGLLATGAETLLVNHHIAKGRLRVALAPPAIVRLPLPPAYIWRRDQLYEAETAHHLHHTLLPRLAAVAHTMSFPLFTLTAVLAALFYADQPFVAAAFLLLWLLLVLVQGIMHRYTCRQLGIPSSALTLPFHLLWLPVQHLTTWLRWCFTPKSLFRKKFV